MPATEVHGIPIPRSYKEAMASKHAKEWEQAIQEEIIQLIKNQTWEEQIAPEGANLVLTK
jgi:hypothetical protein